MTLVSASTPTTPLLDGQGRVTFTWTKFFQALQQSSTQALSQIGGQITTAQLPAGLFTGTVTLAKITGGGANGSLTLVNGSVSAYTPPT
jgi:hypothetical protein